MPPCAFLGPLDVSQRDAVDAFGRLLLRRAPARLEDLHERREAAGRGDRRDRKRPRRRLVGGARLARRMRGEVRAGLGEMLADVIAHLLRGDGEGLLPRDGGEGAGTSSLPDFPEIKYRLDSSVDNSNSSSRSPEKDGRRITAPTSRAHQQRGSRSSSA